MNIAATMMVALEFDFVGLDVEVKGNKNTVKIRASAQWRLQDFKIIEIIESLLFV